MAMRTGRQGIVWAVGDVVAFMLFTVVGRLEHEMSPFAPHFLETALPFTLAWLLVAAAFGLFRSGLANRPWAMTGRVTLAWAIACPIGLFVRACLLDRAVAYLFGAVTFGMMLMLPLLWRLAWVVAARSKRQHTA